MTRAEHLEWAKRRALAYLPASPREAVTSILSDLNKHAETRGLVDGPFAMVGLFEVMNANPSSARRFIEGFN